MCLPSGRLAGSILSLGNAIDTIPDPFSRDTGQAPRYDSDPILDPIARASGQAPRHHLVLRCYKIGLTPRPSNCYHL